MVAGNIERKIKSMTDEDLDAKVIQMLREAGAQIVELQNENRRLKKAIQMVRQATSLWESASE